MHPDAERLFALDAALRAEAAEVLRASGIGTILAEAGYVPVGSQVMRTMVWRDLGFERYREPDWQENWEVGTRLARTGWCTRLQCVNHYRERDFSDVGLYWGILVAPPDRAEPAPKGHPTVWKLDLWIAWREEFQTAARERWQTLLTEESRAQILAIKEAICRDPEYRRTILSVHIYEAVLECAVTDLPGFRAWLAAKETPQ
jgi:hypothetical protein